SPQPGRQAGIVLALRVREFLPRGSHAGAACRHAASTLATSRRGKPGTGRILGNNGRLQLALSRLLLPALLLPGLGPELRRGLPGTLRLPARQPVRQFREQLQLALQLPLVQQRLPSRTPLGPKDALDADARTARANQAAAHCKSNAHFARAPSDGTSRGLVGGT